MDNLGDCLHQGDRDRARRQLPFFTTLSDSRISMRRKKRLGEFCARVMSSSRAAPLTITAFAEAYLADFPAPIKSKLSPQSISYIARVEAKSHVPASTYTSRFVLPGYRKSAYSGGNKNGLSIGPLVPLRWITSIVALAELVGVFLGIPFLIIWCFIVPARRRNRTLEKAGLIRRTNAGQHLDMKIAAEMKDDELLWVFFWPMYTADAKEVAAEELGRRGYSKEDIRDWHPQAEELAVPFAFRRAPNKTIYMLLARIQNAWVTSARLILITCVCLFLIAHFIDGGVKVEGTVWPLFLVVIFISPILGGILFTRRSLRILLLRPFGNKRMTKPLKRFVVKNIGRIGYVYTLSDLSYRPNLLMQMSRFAFALLLFGVSPIIRNSYRIATVRNEGGYNRLQEFLLRRFRPCYYSVLCALQAFNIKSTDAWWRPCILMLMYSCDLIVADLSKIKSGTEWELDQIVRRDLIAKCLFVQADTHQNEHERSLERYFERTEQRPEVYIYAAGGKMVDQLAFNATLDAQVSRALANRSQSNLLPATADVA
jgi:hypothetical protein